MTWMPLACLQVGCVCSPLTELALIHVLLGAEPVVVIHVRNSPDLVLYFQTAWERIGELVTLLVRQLYLRHRLLQVHVKQTVTFSHDHRRTLSLVRGQNMMEPTFVKTSSKSGCSVECPLVADNDPLQVVTSSQSPAWRWTLRCQLRHEDSTRKLNTE